MPLSRLAVTFLRIGALAFGGLGATLALIERELVERQRVVDRAQITDALTYTKLLPGSTVVQVIAYLGWRIAGWTGSAIATTAFLIPSAALMLILTAGYAHIASAPAMVSIRRGVLAVVVALLLLSMERLGRPFMASPWKVIVGVAAFLVVMALNVSAIWAVVLAGIVGLLVEGRRT
jgi:chromate transporter